MTIEELKQKLQSGEITQEQYTAELKKLVEAGTITQEQHDDMINSNNEPNPNGGNDPGGLTLEQVQKMIQSETDKVRTEYSKKLNDANSELDKLKTEKMSAEEKAKYEADKLKSDLEKREKDLLEREVKLHTVDKLRELELPLEFRDILAGSNVEATDERIKSFADQWQKALKDAVDARFKDSANPPGKGKSNEGAGTVNPWKQGSVNLTKQAQLLRDNPELATQLKAQAGVK